MAVRDRLAEATAGGPEFRVRADRILVEVENSSSIAAVERKARSAVDKFLSEPPVDIGIMQDVASITEDLGFKANMLEQVGVIELKAQSLSQVVDRMRAADFIPSDAKSEIDDVVKDVKDQASKTILGGLGGDGLIFNQTVDNIEEKLRAELTSLSLENPITEALSTLDGVFTAQLDYDVNTPGPRNLGVDVTSEDKSVKGKPELPHLGDIIKKINADKAWQKTTGEDAIVAVFDTSFYNPFFQDNRVLDTFNAEGVDSAFSTPKEGHGTMTAYAAAGNKQGNELTYNGVAKDADLLLARVTGADGSLSKVVQSLDWISQKLDDLDRPVIANHSYGIPLCNAVSMDPCDTTQAKIARVLNSRPDYQGFYAAGNEAAWCGHRLSGITNGITGINGDPSSITSGAFRIGGNEAQLYSSHGYGTCVERGGNMKPDLGTMIPTVVPYGKGQKDMSTRTGGSAGGTSIASPIVAGAAALVASLDGTAKQNVLEDALEETAKSVRTTQADIAGFYNARFGSGQLQANKAVNRVSK